MALVGSMVVSKPHAAKLVNVAERIEAKTATLADADFLRSYAKRIRLAVRAENAGAGTRWLAEAADLRARAAQLDDTDTLKAMLIDSATKLEAAAAEASASAQDGK